MTEEYLRTQPLFQPRPGWRRGRAVLVRPRQDRGRPHQAGCGVQGHFLEAVLSWVRRLWVGLRRAGRSGVWTGRPPSSGVAGAGGSVRKGTGWYSWVGCPPGMVEGRCGWSVSFRPAAVCPFSRTSAEMALGTCLPSHLRQHSLSAALPLSCSCGGRPFHQVAQLCGILGLRWELVGKDACFLVELESEKMKAWNSQAHCYHEKAESKTMWNRLEKGIEKLEE